MPGRFALPFLMLLFVAAPPRAGAGPKNEPPAPPPLTVAIDDNYPPYVFRDAQGALQGVLPDLWRLWEQKTGQRVRLEGLDWSEALRSMEEGRADVLDTAFYTEERARLYRFSEPYAEIRVPVFNQKDLGGIRDADSLQGFTVGVKAGDAVISVLRQRGVTTFLEFDSYEDIICAAAENRIRVFSMDEPPAFYYLTKYKLEDEFRQSFILYTGAFHRAVRRDRADLLHRIEEGFDAILKSERSAIERKWMGMPLGGGRLLHTLFLALLVVGAGALVLGFFLLVLRHQVKERTAELRGTLHSLQQSEDKIRSLFRAAPVGIGMVTHRVIQEANDRLCEMTGYGREELLGQSARMLYPTQEDFDTVGREKYRQIEEQGTGTVETPWRRKDGRIIDVLLSSTPLVPGDLARGVTFTALDITERRRALELLRGINDCLVSFGTDPAENLRRIAEAFGRLSEADCVLYKRRHGDQLVTETGWNLQPGMEDAVKGAGILCYEAMAGGAEKDLAIRPLRKGQASCGHPNVKVHGFACCLGCPVRLGSETVAFLCALFSSDYQPAGQDLGLLQILINAASIEEARRQALEERIQLERQVQQTQKLESLGVLAGGIAHDFNNLLTAILGHITLARDVLPAAAPAAEDLQSAERATRRAAELARQMLAYTGKARAEVRPVSVSKIVDDMIPMLKVAVSKKAVLRFDLAPDLPPIRADISQLHQVIMNLVINASEAIGERSGFISLSTGLRHCDRDYLASGWLDEDRPEGPYVYLEVADTGCGIEPESLPRIFDPFYTTKFAGRGLGLAAVLGIVRAHRGALRLDSQPGRGTTFQILFPAADAPVGPEPGEEEPARDWKGAGLVLLADDEESLRVVAGRMLERMGFRVITARDGLEAVDLFRAQARDIVCVIMDLTMPHLDGGEAFRQIRGLRADVPVILSSGYDEENLAARFAGEGLSGFAQKPYAFHRLRNIVRQVMTAPDSAGI
ncbi:MAG: transporter substrate-binding domain-containing protein [Kiritimatiellae bacterium]|nr:transporter substrate-binding domain-containing protein [Kiritimatiellia bacterium]